MRGVAGDAAYNDVHLYLAESDAHGRRSWLTALDTIERLSPRAVVAGHRRPERTDDPKILEETRQYIRDFDALAARTTTTLELYTEMTARYPDRFNRGAGQSRPPACRASPSRGGARTHRRDRADLGYLDVVFKRCNALSKLFNNGVRGHIVNF